MSLLGGRGPAFHIELESIPPVYHKSPTRHATTPGYTETDPNELRRIGVESTQSGYTSPRTEPTTPRALESSRPPSPRYDEGEEEAVGLVPSVNK